MSKNLWTFTDFETTSTKGIESFLEEQGSYLSSSTGGNVIAVFVPKRISTMALTLSGVARVSKQLRGEYPVRGQGTKDASELYNHSCYEYFITDKRRQYELALFNLWLNDHYPITIENIDATVQQEAKMEDHYKIDAFDAFESIYTNIVQTKKVQYIVWKLNQLMKEQDEAEKDNNLDSFTENADSEE